MSHRPSVIFGLLCFALLCITGCAPAPVTIPAPPAVEAEKPILFRPYIPSTQPISPNTDALPTDPRDASRRVDFLYSVEIWEILLPRDSVTTDEAFWKRVDEQSIDLPMYDQLFKNGIRVGVLPLSELGEIVTLIEERRGKRTQLQGMSGKLIEIPINPDLPRQTLFYYNRAGTLIGRTYERCANTMLFSFESTPRNPDRIRMTLTPVVRGHDKKLQFVTIPGKPDREIKEISEERRYDTNLQLDMGLTNALVIAPSVEARWNTSLGNAFLIKRNPSEELERLLIIIPRAFKRDEAPAAK